MRGPLNHLSAVILLFSTLIPVGDAKGALLYSADFSPNDVGFTHQLSFIPFILNFPAASGSASTSNLTLSFDERPGTDSSLNEFRTVNGAVRIQDWGGSGLGVSSPIDVTSVNLVDIALTASELGNGADDSGEFFRWFYQLDSGAPTLQTFSAPTPTDLSHTWNSIDTSSASSLSIGFAFNLENFGGFNNGSNNGADNGFTVEAMSVSAVPEPSTLGLIFAFVAGMVAYSVRLRKPVSADG